MRFVLFGFMTKFISRLTTQEESGNVSVVNFPADYLSDVGLFICPLEMIHAKLGLTHKHQIHMRISMCVTQQPQLWGKTHKEWLNSWEENINLSWNEKYCSQYEINKQLQEIHLTSLVSTLAKKIKVTHT